jgi:hypothetical protein
LDGCDQAKLTAGRPQQNPSRDNRSEVLVESRIMAEILGLRAAMYKAILPALMAMAVLPAGATRHLTVEQLEKTLASSAAKHHADADIMKEFGDFDLTERLTDAARIRITTTLHLGPQTTLALQLLADESSVLDPPPAELPKDAAPDAATQKHILEAADGYVKETYPHLPDFLATRTTYTFNDTPQILKVNEWPVRVGLHLIGKTSREFTYLKDQGVKNLSAPQAAKAQVVQTPSTPAATPQEVKTAAATGQGSIAKASGPTAAVPGPTAAAQGPAEERGLQSFGEFGQLLGIIFIDTQKRAPAFHHWEQTPAGMVAVYRYSVPKADSHFTINYCCLDDSLRTNRGRGGGGRGRGGGGSAMNNVATGDQIPLHMVPGYHGSLFIDPATGTVRRLTLEADVGDGTVSRADTVIEYGQVVIGDRKFVCPLRSMNLWVGPAESSQPASELPISIPQSLVPTGTLYVSETSFTDYHRLGSEMRIINVAEAPPAPSKGETQPTPK